MIRSLVACMCILLIVPSYGSAETVPSSDDKKSQSQISDDVDILESEEELLFKEFDKIVEEDMDLLFDDVFSDESAVEEEQQPRMFKEEIQSESIEEGESLIPSGTDHLYKE